MEILIVYAYMGYHLHIFLYRVFTILHHLIRKMVRVVGGTGAYLRLLNISIILGQERVHNINSHWNSIEGL